MAITVHWASPEDIARLVKVFAPGGWSPPWLSAMAKTCIEMQRATVTCPAGYKGLLIYEVRR